jgi:hypothetical protein
VTKEAARRLNKKKCWLLPATMLGQRCRTLLLGAQSHAGRGRPFVIFATINQRISFTNFGNMKQTSLSTTTGPPAAGPIFSIKKFPKQSFFPSLRAAGTFGFGSLK